MVVELSDDLLQYPDRIAEGFANRTIFITGGTGFLGKVILEKLLRCCSDLRRIYILIRPKKGKTTDERLVELFKCPLFDYLKSLKGEDFILKKTSAIEGDISEINLGLSIKDRDLLCNEVDGIFHGAATIRFDEALRTAVLLNVRGTKFILELAKECKKLMVFVHISTAYCHLNEKILYEKAYPPPADPHHVIKACEWMDDDVFNSLTDKILGDIPNTYAFTKALSEALVVEQLDKLPVIICRPSVVIPIWREPIPGWTDNINGPTGLLIGAGKGVIRTMYIQSDTYADFVPVDVAANAIILAAGDFVYYKGVRKIYNVTSSAEYQVSWEKIIEIGRKIIETKLPLNWVVWYPGGSMKRSRLVHNVCFVLFQFIPAIFLDALLIILGYKPILMRVQKRIRKGYEVFEYYANNQWEFNNDASRAARDLLNPREKVTWKVDGDGIDYEEYFTHCIHAARLYILNETDDTIPTAKRHMKIMWCVDKLCKFVIIFGLLYLLWTKFFATI